MRPWDIGAVIQTFSERNFVAMQEVKKRNQILLYSLQGDESPKGEDEKESIDPATVAGYLMYSWTSLAASITKLAGSSRLVILLFCLFQTRLPQFLFCHLVNFTTTSVILQVLYCHEHSR